MVAANVNEAAANATKYWNTMRTPHFLDRILDIICAEVWKPRVVFNFPSASGE